jgi:hypothetical protein
MLPDPTAKRLRLILRKRVLEMNVIQLWLRPALIVAGVTTLNFKGKDLTKGCKRQ